MLDSEKRLNKKVFLSESVLIFEKLTTYQMKNSIIFFWMLLVPTDLPACPVQGVNQYTTNSYLAALNNLKTKVFVNYIPLTIV